MHIKNLLLPQQARISLKAPHFQSQTPPSEFQFFYAHNIISMSPMEEK